MRCWFALFFLIFEKKKYMKIVSLTKVEIENAFQAKKSIRQILNECGVNSNGSGAYKIFKQHCKKLNITIPSFKIITGASKFIENLNFDQIFIVNSNFSPCALKRKVLKHKLIQYKCEKCNNSGEWQGEVLVLQLDHKNGINNDNRLENLRFLCPNCHTQTNTFTSKTNHFCLCGKKILKESKLCVQCSGKIVGKRKIKIVSKEFYFELLQNIETIGYRKTGEKYGVSNTTVKRWIKNFENKET